MPDDGAQARLVIVGASLAGLRAAEAARGSGWTGPITLIGAEPHLPYDRPPLSKDALAEAPPGFTPLRREDELAELGVDLRLGAAATALDVAARTVMIGDEAVPYDALVLATGAAPIPLPGTEGIDGVHFLRTYDDAVAVGAALDRGARTVVIGAGFIGSEVASAARKRGLPATIVEKLDAPLSRALGSAPAALCSLLHRTAGTELRLGVGVERIESVGGHVTGVTLDDGTTIPADLVVVGIGVRPATGWLRDSGLALHDDGGVLCDAGLATSLRGVWAAGDVAHSPNRRFGGGLMRMEHWTSAAEQGALAGRNAARGGHEPDTLETIPYFWSDWYGHKIQFVGSPIAEEVVLVGPEGPGAIALYRRGDAMVGAFTIDRPQDIMKFRRRVMQPGGWEDALAHAYERIAVV